MVILLGAALVVFSATFPAASRRMYNSRHTDVATNACNLQLEYYRDIGYSSLPAIANGSSSTQVSFAAPADLQRAVGTVTFTRVDPAFAAATVDTGRVRVDATLSWNGALNDRGSVTLTTLILK